MDINNIIALDKELLLKLNGSDSLFLDGFMWFATTTYIWIPTAIALIYIILKNNDLKTSLFTLLAIALVIVVADQVSSSICKPLFQRYRPSHDPEIMHMVDLVRGYCGGRFGFVSSHAANTFGLTTFVYMLIRKKIVLLVMLSWACLNCYSRIYLGVHYPGDIIAGIVIGFLSGITIYYLYKIVCRKQLTSYYSNYCISDKYKQSELSILHITFILTLIAISILSLIFSGRF